MNSKTDWQEVFDKAKEGRLDEIDPKIAVKHYGNLQKIKRDHMQPAADRGHLRGLWLWGEPGMGKSRGARSIAGDSFYPKLANKWWDGYQGEKTVILDDLMPEHKVLGQQLKLWADRYGVVLETKGGAITDDYTLFIVTSQYPPEEIFADDATLKAIKRRFVEHHVEEGWEVQEELMKQAALSILQPEQ